MAATPPRTFPHTATPTIAAPAAAAPVDAWSLRRYRRRYHCRPHWRPPRPLPHCRCRSRRHQSGRCPCCSCGRYLWRWCSRLRLGCSQPPTPPLPLPLTPRAPLPLTLPPTLPMTRRSRRRPSFSAALANTGASRVPPRSRWYRRPRFCPALWPPRLLPRPVRSRSWGCSRCCWAADAPLCCRSRYRRRPCARPLTKTLPLQPLPPPCSCSSGQSCSRRCYPAPAHAAAPVTPLTQHGRSCSLPRTALIVAADFQLPLSAAPAATLPPLPAHIRRHRHHPRGRPCEACSRCHWLTRCRSCYRSCLPSGRCWGACCSRCRLSTGTWGIVIWSSWCWRALFLLRTTNGSLSVPRGIFGRTRKLYQNICLAVRTRKPWSFFPSFFCVALF